MRKATALVSNRRWRTVIKRCDGHRGRPQGILQGQVGGCNRTALAAVYSKRMCQLFAQSGPLEDTSRRRRSHSSSMAPAEGASTAEHALVPVECRYGQPRLQPNAPRHGPARTTRPTLADLEDPTAPFKLLARNGDYSGVQVGLQYHLLQSLDFVSREP